MIPIDTEKRVNWHKIRAEYIGGASQRSLAEKYGVSRTRIERRCMDEKWSEERKAAKAKIQENVIQKTADMAADNATIAAGIKRKGLLLLDKLFDDFVQYTATEYRETTPNTATVKRLRDLTAAYKDLTGDLATSTNGTNELLQSLIDLERGKS